MDIGPITNWFFETNIQAAVIGPIISGILGGAIHLVRRINLRKIVISELIQKVECAATEHWCCEGADSNNRIRAIKITQDLKTLGWRINQKTEYIRRDLTAYRQAVTEGEFDNPERTSVPLEDPRIQLINEKARILRKMLNIKKYH